MKNMVSIPRSVLPLALAPCFTVPACMPTKALADDKELLLLDNGTAYCWWMKYSSLMDSMYYGMTMPRTADLPNWHAHDKSVLKEYTDLGGTGIPSCEKIKSQELQP